MPSITPRQINFIQTLGQERGEDRMMIAIRNAAGNSAANLHGLTSREASGVIERLLAAPRLGETVATPAPASNGEAVEAPSAASRAGRMLLAGGIEATVTFDDGRHCTVTVRTRGRRGRGWANMAPGEEGARTNISILGSRVGWANVDRVSGEWTLTLRTRRDDYRRAILSVFEYAATGSAADGSRVQEASRCGRCFRTLTDPVSIDRGIGPECFGRDTGSQHVAAERAASGDAVVRSTVTGEPGAPTEQEAADFAEAAMNRAVAEGERAEHNAAYDAEMREEREQAIYEEEQAAIFAAPGGPRRAAPSLSDLAARVAAPANANVTRARELIAEALDAYCTDADRDFAMRTFDNLAAR